MKKFNIQLLDQRYLEHYATLQCYLRASYKQCKQVHATYDTAMRAKQIAIWARILLLVTHLAFSRGRICSLKLMLDLAIVVIF
jgi:hypothetical protein